MSVNASKITVTPKYPKANEQVTVTIEDYLIQLNTTNITWSVNNAVQQSGVGLKSFTFTVGDLGSVSRVTASTNVKNYSVTIRPSEVDMIWEALDSHVPPFYEGKALFPNQGRLKIAAIPHFFTENGTPIDPNTLVYKWKKGGGAVQNQSGYGKNSITVTGSLIARPTTYEVEISSSDEIYKGYGSIMIDETVPFVQLYEDDPLYGIEYGKSLNDSTVFLANGEIHIQAVPFFFSMDSANALTYTWSMNGNVVLNDNKDNVVFRGEGTDGISSVSVQTRHSSKIMQGGNARTSINTTVNN